MLRAQQLHPSPLVLFLLMTDLPLLLPLSLLLPEPCCLALCVYTAQQKSGDPDLLPSQQLLILGLLPLPLPLFLLYSLLCLQQLHLLLCLLLSGLQCTVGIVL
jgi:hypothetical protein